ncbi:ribonuclease HI [Leptolyngbya ohadii]|uniref:ribonuclease HI n=1 Tax=Leptolyngbya ohadii TaxID=1962290 RepID=UPI000B5986F3|nr:ribonuclease HI [Leptolyngbya ohadii]
MPSKPQIQRIYTDGACSGNPGPGGWGTVIYYNDGSIYELGGADRQTTNNRMEMQAAIAGLEYLLNVSQTDPVTLYTDSEYVKNGITKWVSGWKRKGWKTSAGKPVLNQDLWEQLDRLNQKATKQVPSFQWQYVRGHSGNEGNERCDTIARAFSLGQTPALRQASPASPATGNTDSNPKEAIESTQEFSQPARSAIGSQTSLLDAAATVSPALTSEAINPNAPHSDPPMVDLPISTTSPEGSDLPHEVRVSLLRSLVETLRMADEIAQQGYLITSSELADLMDVNASAVTSRGDNWVWRNWVVSRVRREGNQILWQLERVD